jgi:hypothetical protein
LSYRCCCTDKTEPNGLRQTEFTELLAGTSLSDLADEAVERDPNEREPGVDENTYSNGYFSEDTSSNHATVFEAGIKHLSAIKEGAPRNEASFESTCLGSYFAGFAG